MPRACIKLQPCWDADLVLLLGWPKSPLHFFLYYGSSRQCFIVFNFIWNNVVRLYQCAFKKEIRKGKFLCSHFNIEDGRKQHFLACYALLFKERWKTQLKHKKRFVQYTKKVLWLIKCVKSDLWSFLVLLTFWWTNALLWGWRVHWKMFGSTPGLYPLETNSGREWTYSKYPNQ